MRRYWRIYRTFLRSSLARELEFRANFIAKLLHASVWTFFFLVSIKIIFHNTPTIGGWNEGAAITLTGAISILDAITRGLFFSLIEIPEQVRKGTLDFVVTKPVDTQFWVSTRRFNFDQIGVVIAGIIMVAYGTFSSGMHVTPLGLMAFVILLLAGSITYYAFNLMLMTTGIWLVRVDNLWVLSDSIVQVARYPADIYNSVVQRVFVFWIPLSFLATVPVRQLKDGFDPWMLALGLAWSVGFFTLSRLFWNFALRSYGSASS